MQPHVVLVSVQILVIAWPFCIDDDDWKHTFTSHHTYHHPPSSSKSSMSPNSMTTSMLSSSKSSISSSSFGSATHVHSHVFAPQRRVVEATGRTGLRQSWRHRCMGIDSVPRFGWRGWSIWLGLKRRARVRGTASWYGWGLAAGVERCSSVPAQLWLSLLKIIFLEPLFSFEWDLLSERLVMVIEMTSSWRYG